MRLLFVAAPILMTSLLTACGDPGDKTSRTAPATSPTAATASVSGQLLKPTTDQGQVAGVASAYSKSQLDLAQVVIDRKIEGPLADFALKQQKTHQAIVEKLAGYGASASGEHVDVQKSKGRASVDALLKVTDQKELMNSYIAEVVRSDEDALAQYDAELVPAAQPELKAYLEQTRRTIAQEAEDAQALASARY
jgi:hypothetical protein